MTFRKSRTSSVHWAAGTTLVEVVGGLALLASLLVVVLLARSRYVRQAAAADQRLRAIELADQLLSTWHRDPRAIKTGTQFVSSGPKTRTQLVSDPMFVCRTSAVANPAVEELGARVFRLDVLAQDDGRVLVSVDFVADAEPAPQTTGTSAMNKTVDHSPRSKPRAKGLHAR